VINFRIKNFQSIKDCEFRVDKFTAIAAPNNLGKSATVRAISHALFPAAGSAFVRQGANYAEVIVNWKDGSGIEHTIVRRKGSTINQYTIDGQSFDKVGRDQIKELVDLGFFIIQDLEPKVNLNISRQFDPPFMVDAGNQTIGHFLNKFSRASVIQKATKKSQLDVTTLNSKIRNIQDNLNDTQKELEVLATFNISEAISSLKKVKNEYEEEEREVLGIKNLVETLLSLRKEVDSLSVDVEIPTIGDSAPLVVKHSLLLDYVKLMQEHDVLNLISSIKLPKVDMEEVNKLMRIRELSSREEDLSVELESLESVPELSFPKEEIASSISRYEKVAELTATFEGLKSTVDFDTELLSNKSDELELEKNRLKSTEKELGICPTCNRPF